MSLFILRQSHFKSFSLLIFVYSEIKPFFSLQVAQLIGANNEEIFFFSCGSETANYVIKGIALGALEANSVLRPHIITTNIEHPCGRFSFFFEGQRMVLTLFP